MLLRSWVRNKESLGSIPAGTQSPSILAVGPPSYLSDTYQWHLSREVGHPIRDTDLLTPMKWRGCQ